MHVGLIALLLVGGCASDVETVTQTVSHGPFDYDVDATWLRNDTSRPGWTSSMFMPGSNDRLESITVLRTRRSGDLTMPTSLSLQQQLTSASRPLRNVRITSAGAARTASGLEGAQVELSFKPPGVERTYRRTHAVYAESPSMLVHVIYTAADPDPDQKAFGRVIKTIHKRGGRS